MGDFQAWHWAIVAFIIVLLFSNKFRGNMKIIGQVLFTLVTVVMLFLWLTGYNTPHL